MQGRADEEHDRAIEDECAAPAESRLAESRDRPGDRGRERHGEHLRPDGTTRALARDLCQEHLSRSRECCGPGQTKNAPGRKIGNRTSGAGQQPQPGAAAAEPKASTSRAPWRA